jgi:hypothetical protein
MCSVSQPRAKEDRCKYKAALSRGEGLKYLRRLFGGVTPQGGQRGGFSPFYRRGGRAAENFPMVAQPPGRNLPR